MRHTAILAAIATMMLAAGAPAAGMPAAGMPAAGMPAAGMPAAGMPEAADPPSAPRAQSPDAAPDMTPERHLYRQRIALADTLADDKDYDGAGPVFDAVLADRAFAALPDEERRRLLSKAAWVAARRDDLSGARALYLRATAIGVGDPDDWYRLAVLHYDLKDDAASAAALSRFAAYWPEYAPNVDTDYLYALLGRLYDASPASPPRTALLQALLDARWDDPEGDASVLWHGLAQRRLEEGRTDDARAAVVRIVSPAIIASMRADKRFDAVIDRDAWAFRVEHAARRAVERMQAKVDKAPGRIDAQVQLSYAMLTAGMNEEVVATTDRLLRAIADAPAGAPGLEDIGSQVWLMNNRAIALRRLGRIDEAVEEMRRAGTLSERGRLNVSQALNLGSFHCALGRPRDALAAIERVGGMSGYGLMIRTQVRHCAALLDRDAAGARRALAYLRKHREDGPYVYLNALVRAGEEDAAARHLIGLLEDAQDRADALSWSQEYLAPPPLPGSAGMISHRRALMGRADVQAAIARVGRIERYGIYGGTDFD